MHRTRYFAKYVSFFMTLALMFTIMPIQTISAEMIGTETVLTLTQAQNARENLLTFLDRKDVIAAMTAQGINPIEAKARVDSLSDTEIMQITKKMEQLPAGGSTLGVVVITAVIVFLILLYTDIMGYTEIFPFVKHRQ